jgi:hypothetical protein
VTRRECQILDRAFEQMVTRAGRQDSHRTAAMAIGVERSRRQEHKGLSVITGLDHIVILLSISRPAPKA